MTTKMICPMCEGVGEGPESLCDWCRGSGNSNVKDGTSITMIGYLEKAMYATNDMANNREEALSLRGDIINILRRVSAQVPV